ncbi:XRE family transcriptional regulator [Petralouisia muris]|jgi:transcriptional regulator with XRE-family HTH domain|uniref:XRE family transcriptional regulator n=1 Tax=Petralouisia muris TaxID=3032872 RepID=A0AC61RVD9_9FIRM|nr:helix-turn-helix transcriptional regulator [Petralouisia muris]TGY95939.1 XRE family transcriptional regulator [Petralouisia muris]
MKDLDFAFIGQRIREIRNEKMLTQEYIAHAVDVNVSHISNIETNKVKVSLTLLVRICNVLDTTIDYILENEYHSSDSVIEHELINIFREMEKERQETLLRIAKIL